MAVLADKLGVAQNTIYWYFKNKDQLLIAVVEAEIQEILIAYGALTGGGILERLRWIHARVSGLGGLISVVHGRACVSQVVRDWHASSHHQVLGFFKEHLVALGVPSEQAVVITQTSLFVFEGLAIQKMHDDAVAQVFCFIKSAILAAARSRGQPNAPIEV